MVKVLKTPSEQQASFPSVRSLPKHAFILGPMLSLQYEYTPKYNPTLGIDPNADTARPAYKFRIPPGRLVMIRPASKRPNDFPPSTCCWTVFIVSNGASIVLEHAAAMPEASVFLSPSVTALDLFGVADDVGDALEAVGGAFFVRPPRGMFSAVFVDRCTTSFVIEKSLAEAMED